MNFNVNKAPAATDLPIKVEFTLKTPTTQVNPVQAKLSSAPISPNSLHVKTLSEKITTIKCEMTLVDVNQASNLVLARLGIIGEKIEEAKKVLEIINESGTRLYETEIDLLYIQTKFATLKSAAEAKEKIRKSAAEANEKIRIEKLSKVSKMTTGPFEREISIILPSTSSTYDYGHSTYDNDHYWHSVRGANARRYDYI